MRRLLALTLAITTAACASAVPPPPRQGAGEGAALPLPSPRPGEARAGEGRSAARAPVPVPRPGVPPVEPFNLERLGGSTESAVVAMLGAPDETRPQPPGKVWVYRQGSCRLEVFLYPSVDVGSMAVLDTALVPNDLAAGERDRCRRGLARRTVKNQ